MSSVKKGQIVSLTIEKVVYKGVGIGYIPSEVPDEKAKAVLVPGTIPGEQVEALIVKKKDRYFEGKKIKKTASSPIERTAPCDHFGVCGGCMWQHMPYEQQLIYKQQFITESITRIGKIKEPYETLPIVPSPEEFYFRNKLEFSFGVKQFIPQATFHEQKQEGIKQVEEGTYLGFHGGGSFDKIVDIQMCHLMSDLSNAILQTIKTFVKKKKLSMYNPHTHEGLMRHVVIREGKNTGEVLVHLITSSTTDYTADFFEPLVEELLLLEKNDTKFESILWSTNDKWSDTADGEHTIVLHGREYIFDKVGNYLFKISAKSFFQTNTHGAEKLYDVVREFVDPKGGEIVLDLYAGTGTIGMYVANKAKKVFSVELEKSSVEDAKVNATMNNILNIEFICGKVEQEIGRLILEKPDIIIIDPPRAGMHPKALELLPRFGSPVFIYVSCNPTTLARDLEYLSKWYRVEKVQGVDMFPHTYHVETVVKLIKK